MSSDWGNDYSLLIHSVEGRLQEYIPKSPIKMSNDFPSSSKRSRLSDCSIDTKSHDEDAFHICILDNVDRKADFIKLSSELEEIKIINEGLKEKLSNTVDEFERYRIKLAKQLGFMEAENIQLKKTIQEYKTNYYDEKTKMQSRIKSLESELAIGSKSSVLSTLPSNTLPVSSGVSWESKFSAIHDSVIQKSEQLKVAQQKNVKLEEGNSSLKQQLIMSRTKFSGESFDDNNFESRDLRRKCSDLENSLRKKCREVDRLESKLQNQVLLEEELNAANSKLKNALGLLDRANAMQVEHNSLLEERKHWSAIFDSINQKLDVSSDVVDSVSSPITALKLLTSTQQKCALLLKSQGESESTILELKKQIQIAENRISSFILEKDESHHQKERLSSRLQYTQQQSKLYEGEVLSLRALLTSFDAEYSIGRPTDESLFALKNEMIASLRTEIDRCRDEVNKLIEKCNEYEENSAKMRRNHTDLVTNATEGDKVNIESDKFQSKEKELQEDLLALQAFTGVDFIPSRTQVS